MERKNTNKQSAKHPSQPSPQKGYRLSWREGQLLPVDATITPEDNGALFNQDITLKTNPFIRDAHIISQIEFKDKGGEGVVEVYANESKCAVLEYDGHAHYWVEINPHGKVQITSKGAKGHNYADIKNSALCEFTGKEEKH